MDFTNNDAIGCSLHYKLWEETFKNFYFAKKTLQNFANVSQAFANSSRRFANSSRMFVYAFGCEALYTWRNSVHVLLFALSRTVCEWFSSRSWRLASVCEVHKLICLRTMTFCTREWRQGTSWQTADFVIFRLAD